MADESGGNRDSTHPLEGREDEPMRDVPARPAVERASVFGDEDPTPPPARPSMSDERPPPVLRSIPAPGTVKAARTLWILSFVLGGAAVFIAFLSGETLMAELGELLDRLAPGYDETEISSLVDVMYWSSLGSLGLVIAVEAILLAMIMNQRGRARWVQLFVLILHAGAALLSAAFLGVGDWGIVIQLSLIAGLALATTGWVLTLFPPAQRWFRMKNETEFVPLD
jgi:hypothetical protein